MANNMANSMDTSAGDQNTHTMLMRIQRGAVALGTDGELGSVQQIVVDRESGELRALVVRQAEGDGGETRELEIPVSHIQHATGSQVQLDFGRADLRAHPELARPYNPDDYTPVYQGTVAQEEQAQRVAVNTDHPVVTQVERDSAAVVMPETLTDGELQTPTDADSQPTTPAMRAMPSQSGGAGGLGGVDTPISPATPIAESQMPTQPTTGQAMDATSAPLTGPGISASKGSLPEYGMDSTLPQRPGADAIGASAATPANDIPPMAVPTPDDVVIVPPQADAPEPMGATPDLSATDTTATDFTPTQPAQLDQLQPVMLGGSVPPVPPTHQLPDPESRPRISFRPSPIVILLLGGVGLLVGAVWFTSRVKRAERAVERQVSQVSQVSSKRSRARIKGQAQRNARQAQRQAQQMTQQAAQQAMQVGRQAGQQARATAATWRDALTQQAQTTGASLAANSQRLASKAWTNAAQLTAQTQATLPGKLASLRDSANSSLRGAGKTALVAPERARGFWRGFQMGAWLGAIGAATSARMSVWGNALRAGWSQGAATTEADTPAPVVVKTTIRPRRIVWLRRRTEVMP